MGDGFCQGAMRGGRRAVVESWGATLSSRWVTGFGGCSVVGSRDVGDIRVATDLRHLHSKLNFKS